MKKLSIIAAAVMASTSAFAGSVTYVAPDVDVIEMPERMGSSGAWIIPLIIAAVILLAVTQGESQDPP